MEWSIDMTEIHALAKWFRKQPKLIQKASGMMLNNFAFGVKREAAAHIARTMTVRNMSFVNSRLRVTKADLNADIDHQRSITGSVVAARFTGWTEQELGTPTARGRIATLAGRGGSESGQLKPSNRLKPGAEVVKISDYSPRGGDTNYGGFIAMLFRRKERKIIRMGKGFFKLPSSKKQLPGPQRPGAKGYMKPLWQEMQEVQEKKTKQPKQIHWLRQARAIYFKKADLDVMWGETLKRLMTPPPKR